VDREGTSSDVPWQRKAPGCQSLFQEPASLAVAASKIKTNRPNFQLLKDVRPAGKWGRAPAETAKPAKEVNTDPAKPAIEVITDFGTELSEVKAEKRGAISACEAFRELIEQAHLDGRNAMGIWQDLVTEHGFSSGYQSIRRFLYRVHESEASEARAVIVTAPGEEGQVDYGSGPMVRDAGTGKYRRTRLFVLTLGYSSKSVRLLTFRSSTQIYERAFRRLGGVPRVIVLDNLYRLA